MKSTRNESSPEASSGEISSKGDSPERGSGGQVYPANFITSATSWEEPNKKGGKRGGRGVRGGGQGGNEQYGNTSNASGSPKKQERDVCVGGGQRAVARDKEEEKAQHTATPCAFNPPEASTVVAIGPLYTNKLPPLAVSNAIRVFGEKRPLRHAPPKPCCLLGL